jgi:hypothetical protein
MSENRSISYFSFPVQDPIKCAKWIESCGLSIPLDVVLNKHYRVCGEHFEKNMFLNDLQNRLQPHAIPVLNTELNDGNKQVCPSTKNVQEHEVNKNKKKITTTKNPPCSTQTLAVNKNKRKLNMSDSNKIDKCPSSFAKHGNKGYKNRRKFIAIPKNVFEKIADKIKNSVPNIVISQLHNDFHCNDVEKKNLDVQKNVNKTEVGSHKSQLQIDTPISETQRKKKPETVIKNAMSMESSWNVLREHNYFNNRGQKNKRWSYEKYESLLSSEKKNDDALPEWYKIDSDDEDANSDTEIKSLAQLLRLEYEKDLPF